MKLHYILLTITSTALLFSSCNKPDDPPAQTEDPKLIFKFKFDSTQTRLDNLGDPETVPAGHAAQSPIFNGMGAHYIELSKQNDIPAYNAELVYQSDETTAGGDKAIDFESAVYAAEGVEFFSKKLSTITPATYKYCRVSLSYQNYDIKFRSSGFDLTGTIASFVGANSYIKSYKVKDSTVTVNANRKQGYWAFETNFPGVPVIEGQAPEGATTVPNPLAATSAIPPGSCLVTGEFATPLVITGNETEDIVITLSVSTNNSFEWTDPNGNGYYEPTAGDTVVDMGVRGLIPIVN